MADKIINCRTVRNSDNSVDAHIVYYEVENGADKTTLSILIKGSDMTDPEDMDELKTLANAQADIDKTAWVATLSTKQTIATADTLNGDVTL